MKEFEKYSIFIFTTTMIGNISNYFFQFIMGRMLDIESFGILNSFVSMYVILSIPATVVMVVASRHVSEYKSNGIAINSFLKSLLFYTFIFSLLYILLGIMLSGLITSYIKFNNIILVTILVISTGISILLSVASGGLQGKKEFFAFGIVGLIFPLTRLFGGILFVYFGFRLYGVILSFLIGNIFSIIIGLLLIRKDLRNSFENNKKTKFRIELRTIKYAFTVFFVNIGMAILLNIDIIFVKRFFSSEATGFYSVASILGKTILYISSSLVLVMFPFATEASVKNNYAGNILIKTLSYGGGLSLIFAIVLNIFTKQAITILFGKKYLEAKIYIMPISFWIISLSLITIISNYSLAVDQAKQLSFSLIVGCILSFIFVYFFHANILHIIYVLAIISFVVLFFNILSLSTKNFVHR